MRKITFLSITGLLILALTGCQQSLEKPPTTPKESSPPVSVAGDWQGNLNVLAQEFNLLVHFVEDGELVEGTVDIPNQGVDGLALSEIHVNGNRVHFEMQGDMPLAVFEGEVKGELLTGEYRQSAFKGKFELERVDLVSEIPETPTPKAHIPYLEEEVRFRNGEISLAGTLTLPKSDGPHVAVVLLSGSGLQDRDNAHYSVPGYQPFRWIADHLTRAGIAVLRYDDRGVGESKGGESGRDTTFDYGSDAEAALNYLLSRSEINPNKIGLMGHSEGSFIAAIIAAENPQVAFVVSLAGAGVPGSELMLRQGELFARAEGMSETEVQAKVEANQEEMRLISEKDWEGLEEFLYQETLKYYRSLPEDQRASDSELEQVAREQAAGNMEGMKGWFYTFVTADLADYWQRVDVPVLALFGETDMQVDPEQNVPALEAALEQGGNQDVTIIVIPGANHLFQPDPDGETADYTQLPMKFAPGVLDTLREWIIDQ